MGCGASVDATRRKPLLAPAQQPQRLTTPPPGVRHAAPPRPPPVLTNASNLRVEVPQPPSRDRLEVGMAETPSGSVACEYKFFCPLCMVFYRDIFETPCCGGYMCGFCHAEFLISQTKRVGAVRPPAEKPAGDAPHGEKCIPCGLPCPHCNVESRGIAMRKLTQRDTVTSRHAFSDSPRTLAAMAKASVSNQPPQSPLRIGDDFAAMARKLNMFDPSLGGGRLEAGAGGGVEVDVEAEASGRAGGVGGAVAGTPGAGLWPLAEGTNEPVVAISREQQQLATGVEDGAVDALEEAAEPTPPSLTAGVAASAWGGAV